ncbi:MAG: hypothetical protein OEM22_01555 [Acidimicrobiia bacterium]|nr:hypothetical protein [Acidimicrobiia bacterium]
MNLSITRRVAYAPSVEFVERKGVGHPDTICDALAEQLARRLATGFLENTGAIQHFNVDKAILAAGTVDVDFGGGKITKQARLILVGKANTVGWSPDMDALKMAAEHDLAELLPDADPDAFDLDIWLSQSSSDLALVNSSEVPLSNDTSFAAVSYPRSPLESAVYNVERYLNSNDFRSRIPVGRDIKVMGSRMSETQITVAVPVLANQVTSRADYDAAISEVATAASAIGAEDIGGSVAVSVNGADSDDSPYLTLSGTSAEAGDDGQVGRGNRFGGLITPYRPMSLEAAAGKNPAAHVGKTYHAIAYDIARRVVDEAGAAEATVRLLSRIGAPVTDPQVAHIEVSGEVDDGQVNSIAKESLADWDGVRDRLVAGQYELY